MKNTLAVFEDFKIRRVYDEVKETWYFSIVDIIGALTNQHEHRRDQSYWTTLKNRLKEEGSEVVTKCDHLKLAAFDRGSEVVTECNQLKFGILQRRGL